MFSLDLSSIHSRGIFSPDLGRNYAGQLFMLSPRIVALLFSLVRRRKRVRKRGRSLSLSERRKLINRKQRWFTDNIIMHHRRLHDKNREIAVRLSYEKIIDKQKSRNPILSKQNLSWCQRVDVKNRALLVKERLRARKVRAISRWGSLIESS
jgi:hypothetical protein